MKRIAGILTAISLLTACSLTKTPNLMNHFQKTGAENPDAKVLLTDYGIVEFAFEVVEGWGVRGIKSNAIGMTGAISLAALSTGAVVAPAQGAGVGVIAGIAASFNFLLQVLGIVKPDLRENAFASGSSQVLRAVGEYAIALKKSGMNKIPTDLMSNPGAVLLDKVLAAINVTSQTMIGLSPRFSDMKKLQPIDPSSLPADDGTGD